eukprot:1770114-Rhodomonas_salina.2
MQASRRPSASLQGMSTGISARRYAAPLYAGTCAGPPSPLFLLFLLPSPPSCLLLPRSSLLGSGAVCVGLMRMAGGAGRRSVRRGLDWPCLLQRRRHRHEQRHLRGQCALGPDARKATICVCVALTGCFCSGLWMQVKYNTIMCGDYFVNIRRDGTPITGFDLPLLFLCERPTSTPQRTSHSLQTDPLPQPDAMHATDLCWLGRAGVRLCCRLWRERRTVRAARRLATV